MVKSEGRISGRYDLALFLVKAGIASAHRGDHDAGRELLVCQGCSGAGRL